MTAKKHRWTRPPNTLFVLKCGDCGRKWQPDQSEPKGECVPGPDKAVSA